MSSHLPQVIRSVPEILQWRQSIQGKVGLVPTMGALHLGHQTLLREIRPQCDVSVLSIYVNPTQFGPQEDFSKYPKTFERDLEMAAQENVDVVFAPISQEMYPASFSTYVEETLLSRPLCGSFRPGHFRGVTTIVLKLFNLVRPQLALFGLKDAQQFFVIEKMVRDLHLNVTVRGVPTVRDRDGLALSSRNTYLSADERTRAPRLYQALTQIQKALGERIHQNQLHGRGNTGTEGSHSKNTIQLGDIKKLLAQAQNELSENGFRIQYLDCLALPLLTPPTDSVVSLDGPLLIAAAAFLGSTRLIDNIIFNEKQLTRRS